MNVRERNNSLIDQVNQATRRCNKNVDATLKRALLVILTDSTKNNRVTQAGAATIGGETFGDLRSEFTSWRKNERAWLEHFLGQLFVL